MGEGFQVPRMSYAHSRQTRRLIVPEAGLEPAPLTRHDFESCAATITPLRQTFKCVDSVPERIYQINVSRASGTEIVLFFDTPQSSGTIYI